MEKTTKTIEQLKDDIISAAQEVNLAAFSLLRWGDVEAGNFRVDMKHVDNLEKSRMKLKRAIDKLDLETDRIELLKTREKTERRKLDEELGFKPRCLTLPNDSASGWDFDMFGRPVYSQHDSRYDF